MILTPDELRALTRRDRPKAQAKVLDALGVPYRPHPDGTLVVSRAAAELALGATIDEAASSEPVLYEVNVEGIRSHGKATTSH